MRDYWQDLAERDGVPRAIGLRSADELDDLHVHLRHGWSFSGRLLDVGCGIGRVSSLASDYVGVDIAPAMVAHCQERGLDARLIDGPGDLPQGPFDRTVMLSVMTHMGRAARQEYLAALRPRTGALLVDILPGTETDGIAIAYADPESFEDDLAAVGFTVVATWDISAKDGAPHRYYHCV